MMGKHHWERAALGVLMSMIAGCAGTPPTLMAVRANLPLPDEALRPCRLVGREGAQDMAALEIAYMRRGEALVSCENARRLAVETLLEERRISKITSG